MTSWIFNIKDIKIHDTCYETYPCIHPVEIVYKDNSSEVKELDGSEICEILESLGKEIPEHFEDCKGGFKPFF